ncbi:MAG: hypothetical protein OHK006_22960 [Thermodesulfovibrionales bacterium]
MEAAAATADELREYIEQGTARGQSLKYAEDAVQAEQAGNIKAAASLYLSASVLSRTSGNYQKAIECGQKAIDLSRDAGPADIQAKALLQTARAYLRVAQQKRAAALAEEAAAYAGRYRMRGIEASANQLLGSIYRKTDLRTALKHLREAFDYYDTLLSEASGPEVSGTRKGKRAKRVFQQEGHVINFIDIATSLANAYLAANEIEAARDVLGRAARFSDDSPIRTMKIQMSLGDLDARLGHRGLALDRHLKACAAAVQLDLPHVVMQACRRTGNDLEHLGRQEESIAYYERAVRAIEDQRSMIQSEEMRSGYFDQMLGSYNDMINALVRLDRSEEAFSYSERSRARTFLDLLASKADLSRGRASSLIEEELQLKQRMSALQLKLDETDDLGIKDELDELQRAYADFLVRLRKDDPEHAALLSAEPLSLGAVQQLLGPNRALIEFHVLGGRTIRWIIRRHKASVAVIPEGRKEINARLHRLRAAIEKVGPLEDLKKDLRELHALLFRDGGIREGEELIFVPHDMLHYLPFAALVSREGRYLIEDHAVSYLSSASLLQFTRAKSRRVDGQAVAFGNPDLGNPAYSLRYAEREAREIRLVFPQSAVFLQQNATETRAKELSNRYSVVHFAAHAELNEKEPRATALRLATDSSNDGDLSVAEVFGMSLSSSLVVLSACETELGPISRGDEIVGLTRAFIYAGTPSVITTLWSVNDKAAYFLMADFYRHIRSMRKLDALRTAQIGLIKAYPHPFYWAAFMLTGDTE